MKQHTVARSYLARWCDPATPAGQDPYVWLFEKESREGKRKAPKNVFRVPHIYTDKRREVVDKLWLERRLGRVESELARVMQRVIKCGEPLSGVDKAILAAFAATMVVRTPSYQEHLRSQWEPVFAKMESFEASIKKMTPAQIKAIPESIDGSGPSMSKEDVREVIDHPLQTKANELARGMLGVLLRMKCGILYTPNLPGFITCDAPSVIFDPLWWKMPWMYRGGLGSKTAEVTLPLSPNFLALFGWQMDADLEYAQMPDEIVDEMNRRTRFRCDRHFIVCQNESRDHWFDPGEPPPGALIDAAGA